VLTPEGPDSQAGNSARDCTEYHESEPQGLNPDGPDPQVGNSAASGGDASLDFGHRQGFGNMLSICCCVGGGWPSALMAIISLRLPLIGAYFPPRFHRYFKPKCSVTSWFVPSDIKTTEFPEGVGLLVSGSKRFIDGIMRAVGPTHWIIALVEIKLHGATLRGLRKSRALAKELLKHHGMHPVSFLDAENGGATDACHVFGFGGDLCLDILPTSLKGLPLTLRHFLDGGVKGAYPKISRVPHSAMLVVPDPPRAVLWHLDAVLGEGLFPCTRPRSLVYCPSHFFPGQWI